jgi:cytochrome c biogenesis protein CcmG/thiol:disulfide interchange protein DsbE
MLLWMLRRMAVPEFYSGKILYPAIGVLVALTALFGLAILPRLSPRTGGVVGKPAPDASFPLVANGDPNARMQISSLKGHPVVLDFWATWCGPCAVQAPILDRIARRHQKKGLIVLGINAEDPPEAIRAYTARKGLSYPMVLDVTKEAFSRYGVSMLPSVVVIDKEGRIAAYFTGLVDEAHLDAIVASSL